MISFLQHLFDAAGFPPRWHCGAWSDAHGWLHILSDLAIFGAYAAIPLALAYFIRRRKDVPFIPLFWLFAAFIVSCGVTHLIEATIFWHPWYRLSGLAKVITAVVSWMTVIALIKVIPTALALPGMAQVNRQLREEIAERQQAEAAWRESEERFRAAVSISSSLLWTNNPEGMMEGEQPGWGGFTGQTRDEYQGYGWAQAVHPDDAAPTVTAWQLAVAEKRLFEFEHRVRRHDGEWRRCSIRATPLFAADGTIREWLGVHTDITERQQAEAALREKEHFLERITQVTPGILHVFDLVERRTVFVNRTVASVLGFSPQEVEAMGSDAVPTLIHPEDLPRFEQHLARVCALADGEIADFEHRMRDRAGAWHSFHSYDAVFARDAAGAPQQIIGVATESTERKRAEAALARLAAIVESSHDALFSADIEGIVTSWNRGAEQIFGYRADEIIGTSVMRLIPEARHEAEHELQRNIIAGERGGTFETIRKAKDGREFPASITLSPLKDAAGKIIGTSRVVRDITERKADEAARRDSEERTRLATEATGVGIWEWNVLTDFIRWDAQMFQLYGVAPTPDGFVSYDTWSRAVMPEELARQEEVLQDTVARLGKSTREFHILRADDGECRSIQAVETVRANEQGKAEWVIGTNLDVTERIRAEEAVRAAGERFRFMAESMPQKIFTAEPSGDFDYLNRQWLEFTGTTVEHLQGRGWLQWVHPEDMEETIRCWKHSIDTGEPFDLEHRLRRQDGEYRWNVSRAHAMRDAEGDITMWIGSNTDIHDMTEAQEELIDAEAQLADRAVQLESLVAERTEELTTAHARLLAEADERKRLEAEIATAIESERERLGQELHDGTVQELTGLGMMMHVLARALTKSAPAYASEAERLCRLMETAHGNARDLAKGFYPVELEQHGLVRALEAIAQRSRKQFGVSCEVQADAEAAGPVSDPKTSVQLFRIAQEAVQNASKHAKATKILIHLSKKDGAWQLTVKDNGIGLPEGGGSGAGMGMRIMQYRARIIHGTLTVRNDDEGGVLVSCSAPAAAL